MSQTVDEVKFGLFPRFYILCYVSEEMSYKFIELIREHVENEKLKIEGIQFIDLIPFKFDNYDTLGAVEIRMQELTLEYMETIDYHKQTAELFSFSQKLESAIEEVNKSVSEDVFLDHHNPPYFIAITNSSSLGDDYEWTKSNIELHKRSLGRWVEFYSGQFADYSDELWEGRIENNLSNRVSELHFIRLNSAFIYRKKDSWFPSFLEYMEDYFINQILRVKALLLSFYVLNGEIDSSNKYLHSLEDPTLKQIQTEIDSISKKKVLIDNLNDELIKEQMMNRRAHSKKTLQTCINLFSIPFIRDETNYKIQRLTDDLDNERAEQQQKFANSQKKWLLILNLLLGSSVIFTVVDRIKTLYPQDYFSGSMIDPFYSLFYQSSDFVILGFLVLVAVIGGGGLVYNFVKRQIGFRALKGFFKRKKEIKS